MTAASRSFFIEPLSPLVLRSGRPFGVAGQTGAAAGPTTPLPGSMAGTLRAAWCAASGHRPLDQDSAIDRLHLHGPLQMTWPDTEPGALPPQPRFWLPAPANARAHAGGRIGAGDAVALWPEVPGNGSGCNLPSQLWPVLPVLPVVPANARLPVLVDSPPALWNLEAVVAWLKAGRNAAMQTPWKTTGQILSLPGTAEVAHIRTGRDRRAEDGAYFVNVACDYTLPADEAKRFGARGLWVRAEVPALTAKQRAQKQRHPDLLNWQEPDALLGHFDGVAGQAWRLGADGAAAEVQAIDVDAALEELLKPLHDGLTALNVGDTLCLMLATPGCFDQNGWYPWLLRDDLSATSDQPRRKAGDAPQDAPEGRLIGWPEGWCFRLRAALVGSPLAQGSFKRASLRDAPRTLKGRGREPGPTARANAHTAGLGRLQWLAPAGSLYWFEVIRKGSAPDPRRLQLHPCTRSQYGRDGHALALYARAAKLLPGGPPPLRR